MKKNAMLKIAAILMVAVLLTTCAISSTFAKYVTTGTGSQTARIAKFGLAATVTVDGFADTYATDNSEYQSSIANSVSADAAVVAPGTTKEVKTALSATGTAEVAVKVVSEFVFTQAGFSSEYFPIYFVIDGTAYKHKSIDSTSTLPENVDEFLAKVAEKLSMNDEFAPNDTVSIDEAVAFTWKWDFENDLNGDGIMDADAKDNELAADAENITFTVTVNTTITQIN